MKRVTLSRTRVGRYYRTTIPREVRKILGGIKEGDVIEWVLENGKIAVEKPSKGGENER